MDKIQALETSLANSQNAFRNYQQENVQLKEENKNLKTCIMLLQYEKQELERSQKLDSTNSSKPPSSDGLKKQNRTSSLRKKSNEKPGRKKGSITTTLRQTVSPNKIVELKDGHECTDCDLKLDEVALSNKYAKRQKFDLPEPKLEITEFRLFKKKCPKCNHTIFPPCEINGRVQYGNKISSLSSYLNNEQLIPLERLSNYFESLHSSSICPGTMISKNKKLDNLCKQEIEKIKKYLELSEVKHLDETGFRMESKTSWLHSMSDKEATLYRASKKRGDVPEDIKGIVIHDNYCSYNKIKNAIHALCNVHHLRELKALKEIEKENWAEYMFLLLKRGNDKKLSGEKISSKYIKKLERIYNEIIKLGLAFHENLTPIPKKAGSKRTKRRRGHNLLIRLKNNKEKILLFLKKKKVSFSNNQAERDIRMMKLKQKISGCFRTEKFAEIFCNIKSVLSTLNKQDINILDGIEKILNKQSVLNLTPT